MSYVPRCEVCWRAAVAHARNEEEAGRTRPHVFPAYLARYRLTHLDGAAMRHGPQSEPLEVPGFGGSL